MDKKEFIATLVERLYQRGNETQIKEYEKIKSRRTGSVSSKRGTD